MIYAKCIHKFRDKNNAIIGYRLQDINGNTQDVQAANLKNAIRNGQIHIVNLKLTSDNKLIDHEEHILKNKKVLGPEPSGVKVGKLPDDAYLVSSGDPLVPIEKEKDINKNRRLAVDLVIKVLNKIHNESKLWEAKETVELTYAKVANAPYISSITAHLKDVGVNIHIDSRNNKLEMGVESIHSSGCSYTSSFTEAANRLDKCIESERTFKESKIEDILDESGIGYDIQSLDEDGSLFITIPDYSNLVDCWINKDGASFSINNSELDGNSIASIQTLDISVESLNKANELIQELIDEYYAVDIEDEVPTVVISRGKLVNNNKLREDIGKERFVEAVRKIIGVIENNTDFRFSLTRSEDLCICYEGINKSNHIIIFTIDFEILKTITIEQLVADETNLFIAKRLCRPLYCISNINIIKLAVSSFLTALRNGATDVFNKFEGEALGDNVLKCAKDLTRKLIEGANSFTSNKLKISFENLTGFSNSAGELSKIYFDLICGTQYVSVECYKNNLIIDGKHYNNFTEANKYVVAKLTKQ